MFTFSFKFLQTSLITKELIKHENKFNRKVFHDRENYENRFSAFSFHERLQKVAFILAFRVAVKIQEWDCNWKLSFNPDRIKKA